MDTSKFKQIGKGTFSTVYKKNNSTVLIKSRDYVKECLALNWMPDSSLFPKLKKVGVSNDGKYQFYECKYYPKVRKLKGVLSDFDYDFYKALRNLNSWTFSHNGYSYWIKQFESLPSKFHHRKKVLIEAMEALSNYGADIRFEISPRNIAIQGKKLILLDVFFFSSLLKG